MKKMILTAAILTGLFTASFAQNQEKAPVGKPNPPRQDRPTTTKPKPALEKSVANQPNALPNDKGPKGMKSRPKKRIFKNPRKGRTTPPIVGGQSNQTDRKNTINQAPKKN